jgi:DNA-binding Xre family transcriptional regulator
MPADWRLREYLASRGVIRASQARRMIKDATGYELSKQAMCALFNGDLRMLRLETGVAICDTFYCRLSDFFDIAPRDSAAGHLKESHGNRLNRQRGKDNSPETGELFPNRRNFSS